MRQRDVGGLIGRSVRCCLRVSHGSRYWIDRVCRHVQCLRKATMTRPKNDAIAFLHLRYLRTDRNHIPRCLASRCKRQRWFELVFTLNHQQIREVDRTGLHFDLYFAWPRICNRYGVERNVANVIGDRVTPICTGVPHHGLYRVISITQTKATASRLVARPPVEP